MKERLFQFLTRRAPQARQRYLSLRAAGTPRYKAWPRLLVWTFQGLLWGEGPALGSGKQLPPQGSESQLFAGPSPQQLVESLAPFQVVSFDVFDTLLLRGADDPQTLFHFVGARLGCPDFRRLRVEAESRARRKKQARQGTGEVTLAEIWQELSQDVALPVEEGMAAELQTEKAFCRGNPYFLPVVQELRRQGKTLALLSDMYLPTSFIQSLVEAQGYGKFSLCLVSGEEGVSKGEGALFDRLRHRFPPGTSFAHVGDNPHADGVMAQARGFVPFLYGNVNAGGKPYRAEDLSQPLGSVYRGIVNRRLHNGGESHSPLWEYGFVYGGLFALGYCRFIREQAQTLGADKILFLARDGAVLFALYRHLYPEDTRAVYAYWSRMAAAKVTASLLPGDFFRRFLGHSPGRPLKDTFSAMGLSPLVSDFCHQEGLSPQTPLTHKNASVVQHYLRQHWDEVLSLLQPQRAGAGLYYQSLLGDSRLALAVDIGWAGSGAAALSLAAHRLWGLQTEILGLVAGTNSAHSPEPDAAAPLLVSGQLRSYLFSPGDNRDLWKFHDPAAGHNLFFELLLGSEEGSLRGFSLDSQGKETLEFGPPPPGGAAREIHRGILDFAREFCQLEAALGQTLPLSGRDAYAPMLEVLREENAPFRRGLEEYLDEPGVG